MKNQALIFKLLLLLFFAIPGSTYASTLSLSPAQNHFTLNSTFQIELHLNTGNEAVNAISTTLSYPQDKLEVLDVNIYPAFSVPVDSSFGNGAITITRGSLSPVSGDIVVALITFKAKALGVATVSFSQNSAATRFSDASDSLNRPISSASYTIDNTSADTTPSVSPTPAPLTGNSLQVCKSKESAIKNRSDSLISIANRISERLNQIVSAVDVYYQNMLVPKGNNLSDYNKLSTNVKNKQAAVNNLLKTSRDSLGSFSCASPNPRGQLDNLQSTLSRLKQALSDYRDATAELIVKLLAVS